MEHEDEGEAAAAAASKETAQLEGSDVCEAPRPTPTPPPAEDTTPANILKRRTSGDEEDGEKRLREDDDDDDSGGLVQATTNPPPPPPLPPTTEAPSPNPSDPQMQVSSLESDECNDPLSNTTNPLEAVMLIAKEETESQEQSNPLATAIENDPLATAIDNNINDFPPPTAIDNIDHQFKLVQPPDSDDAYDVSAKLREMGEITLQSVSKSELAATKRATVDDEEPVDEVSLTKRSKDACDESDERKKATNLRKNIRDVIDDTMLDASTLAAQREEQERLNRVQEQQRVLRALHRQTDLDKRQSSILSLLQGTLDPLTDDPLSAPAVSISAVRVLDKKTGQVLEEMPDQQQQHAGLLLEPGEIPNPALAAVQLKEAQLNLDKGTSDPTGTIGSGVTELKKKLPESSVTVIDDSSDDDCIMLSDEEEEQDDNDDPHNSGLHVNDTYNLPDDEGRVLVNFGHTDTEQDVYVAPQIARALKPHQIGGIRFLYDNIIESLDRYDSSTGFGCILAHSMGLGKTLQLVCFCDIILRHTSAKTVLCIMPINTLQNWLAEFNWWLPEEEDKSPLKEFGPVRGRNFKIHVLNDSQKTIAARSKVVLNWTKTGGVLLIGYELYRLLCLKKVVKKRGKRAERDPKYAEKEQAAHGELLEEIYEALVKPGPDLVVCDEGHRIKSSHASTSVALKQIRTKRRVVLTGYPLQNNLLEYWCMVDFVRPNYLGTKTEFTNMFEKPIQNGQCIDSTPQDIKLMRYRAHVLHSLLLGFVQRRSHLVLQSTLPNKLEYVMLVRMTAFQRRLYDVFMNEVVRKKAVPNPLKAFAVCCKIWNHPDVLYNFLKKREADLEVELEEEMAMAELKRVRKEREKKVKEESKAAAKAEAEAAAAVAAATAKLAIENGVKREKDSDLLVPKVESQSATNNYPVTGMNQYGGINNAFAGYNSTNDPMHHHQQQHHQQHGGATTYDAYGNVTTTSDYYSHQYNNNSSQNNSYQAFDGHQQQQHHPHHQQQQYYSNEGGDKVAKVQSYWGSQNNHASYGGNNGNQSYYDQTQSQYSSQDFSMGTTGGGVPVTPVASDIPTTVTDTKSVPELKPALDSVKEEGEVDEGDLDADEDSDKESGKKGGKGKTPEKETKSSRDDGIPYEWAVELMKDYVPDLLENAPKMEIFFCILNESMAVGDRILVFSQSLLTLNLIERYLQKHKVPKKDQFWAKNTNYFRLDGSTTACDRERLINEFNTNEDVAIFLVSTRAGSLGINLVGANRVIVFDASWNPCHDTQAVCRVYRYGQKKPCFVYRMVMDNCLEKRIYDRQVNKQGMSDRVVDECNPDAHLSIKEVTNLCWDNDEESEVQDFAGLKDQYPDLVMQKVLEKYSTTLSKEPFRHESLLVDRKEKKLSMAEKRLAQRGYELEKQASTKTAYNYTGKVTQYRVFRTADGTLVHRAVGAVQSLANSSGTTGGTTGSITTGSGPSKWIPAEVWRQQGMTTQETTLPADVTIPSNSGDKNSGILLKAGQKVMILKSSKGVYMQLETGKIIAIRTGPKAAPGTSQATMNIPRPRGFGDANEVIKLDDDDEEEDKAKKTDVSIPEAIPSKAAVVIAEEKVAVATKTKVEGVELKSSAPTTDTLKLNSLAMPLSSTTDHQMGASQSSSATSGYYEGNNSGYPSSYSSTSSSTGYRQPQYDASSTQQAGSSAKAATSSSNRDYGSSSYPSGYSENRTLNEYQQQPKAYTQAGHELPAVASSQIPAVASHGGQGYSATTGSGGAYGGLYPGGNSSTGSQDTNMTGNVNNNGQYGSAHSNLTAQQTHTRSVAAVPPSPVNATPQLPITYPQSGYDYSNRYYDQQSKALAQQFSHSAAAVAAASGGGGVHYPPAPNPSQSSGNYTSAYPNASSAYHHAQYTGQHRPTMPGEYNPNAPPYYMNPYGAGAAAAGGNSVAGLAAYQSQAYGQSGQGMGHDLSQTTAGQQQQQQSYSDPNSAYGQAYANQGYNGPASVASAAGQMGKLEGPATDSQPHKKKESSRRKAGDSAFHKPSTATPDVGVGKTGVAAAGAGSSVAEKKETAATNSNYYDRTPGSSSSFGAFPSPYSPYNYPPSAYFYPGSYHAPPLLPEHSSAPSVGRESSKEGKSSSSSRSSSSNTATPLIDPASKYYDLNRTSAQHYQPPKW